jgi:hypothetical protein
VIQWLSIVANGVVWLAYARTLFFGWVSWTISQDCQLSQGHDMALTWAELEIDADGFITVPSTFGGQTIQTYTRTSLGRELTYLEGDANSYDVQVRNFTLTPNSGTADTVVQIFGGHPGTQVLLRPGQSGWVITLEDGANLHIPTGTIELSELYHVVCLVCVGTNEYAKLLL